MLDNIITYPEQKVYNEISSLTFEEFRANYEYLLTLQHTPNVEITKYAKSLLAHGYSIIPIQPGSKKPIGGYKQYQTEQIAEIEPGYNIAIVPAYSGHCIIDVDIKDKTPEQIETVWQFLESKWQVLSQCPCTLTPGNGFQFLTKLDKPSNKQFFYKGVHCGELRTENYGILAGSYVTEYDKYYIELNSFLSHSPQFISDINTTKPEKKQTVKVNSSSATEQYNAVNPEKYFQGIIDDSINDILASPKGERYFTLMKVVRNVGEKVRGFERGNLPYSQLLIDNLLNVCLAHNRDNDNCNVSKVFNDSYLYGYSNSLCTVNHVININIKSNKESCHTVLIYRIRELLEKHSLKNNNKRLRSDSKLFDILKAIYTSSPPNNYNDSDRYLSNGLWVKSVALSQLAKYLKMDMRNINKAIQLLERWGILKRYDSDNFYHSTIIEFGNDEVGLYLESPLAEDERTQYQRANITEQFEAIADNEFKHERSNPNRVIKIKRPTVELVPQYDY